MKLNKEQFKQDATAIYTQILETFTALNAGDNPHERITLWRISENVVHTALSRQVKEPATNMSIFALAFSVVGLLVVLFRLL